MLLERRSRPVRGIRLITRDTAPFSIQIVPLRRVTVDDVLRTLDGLTDHDGPIVTSALSTIEQRPFIEAGFAERESLHLLRHNFRDLPRTRRPLQTRKARRADLDTVLRIDADGFDAFWRMDERGLVAARRATPTHRYRVATNDDDAVIGYTVAGLAGATSYLQRLSVDRDHRHVGTGTGLVLDAIDWAMRRGALAMMVNTQESNLGAISLYESLGFLADAEKLRVLEWPR
ncbi:MAG: GNAT family N-acetyltransferase [Acidimicrobiales bacterium]